MPLNIVWAFSMFKARLMPPVAASVVTPAVTIPMALPIDFATLPKLFAKYPATCEPTPLAVSVRPLSFDAEPSTPESKFEPS